MFFYHMDFPLNANGDGPETDESLIVSYMYEVWDQDCVVVLRNLPTSVDAQLAADDLNRYWSRCIGPHSNS